MSAFYIGQRVRIVTDDGFAPETVGRQATVIGIDQEAEHFITGVPYIGYDLNIDGLGTGDEDFDYCFEGYHLEPILPAGLESLDLINQLYEPEPEAIRV